MLRMFDEFIQDAPEQFEASPGSRSPRRCLSSRRTGMATPYAWWWCTGRARSTKRKVSSSPSGDVAPIVADGSGPLPYPALNGAFDALYPKGLRAYWKGSFVKDLPESAIAAHIEHGSKVPEVTSTMHLYPINGACDRVGANDTAFAYRDAKSGWCSWPGGPTQPRTPSGSVAARLLPGVVAIFGARRLHQLHAGRRSRRIRDNYGKTTTAWSRSSGPTILATSST